MSDGNSICQQVKISDYMEAKGVELIKSGKRLKCRCPLPDHPDDDTPSFYVGEFPDGAQYFKCFGCIPGSQEIIKYDGAIIRADEVRNGDVLADVYGLPVTVLVKNVKKVSQPFIRIKTTIDNNGFVATSDHNMLWVPCPIRLGDSKRKYGLRKADRIYEIELRHLQKGQWVPVAIPRPYNEKTFITLRLDLRNTKTHIVEVDEHFAWLSGYYAAEGSVSGNRCIAFDMHEKEIDEIAPKIDHILNSKMGLKVKVVPQPIRKRGGKGRTVTVCHAGLARWFMENVGHKCDEKRLPKEIERSNLHVQASWVLGVLQGDGDKSRSSISMTSKNVILQIFRIGLMAGAIPSLYRIRQSEGKKPVYGLGFKKGSLSDIIRIAKGGVFVPRSHKDVCHVEVEYNKEKSWILATRIEDICYTRCSELVYDFAVSGSSTYSCPTISVHNCGESGNIISLIRMMEGKSNKQVFKELSSKLGLKLGPYDPAMRIEPLPEDILERFFEEEAEMQSVISYARRYLLDRGGCEDAINKVSRLYRKLDRLVEEGDPDGIHRVMEDMIELMIETGGER